MLKISDQTTAAFETEYAARMPVRFQAWWLAHPGVLGTSDSFRAEAIFAQYKPEAAFFGIDDEPRLFLFVAARFLMPDMGDEQLVEVLNAIFADAGEADRLAAIVAIAGKY